MLVRRSIRGVVAVSLAASFFALPALATDGVEDARLGQFRGTVAITKAVSSTPAFIVQAQAQSTETSGSDGAQFVRSIGEEVINVLKTNQSIEQRKKKFHDIFLNAFDVESMAQFAAGTYWRRADDRQKQEYIKLFGDYVASLYATTFSDYSGQSFKVTNERTAGDNVAVEGTIVQGQKPPVRIEFRLRKAESGFKIVDVYVEGLSLLITKRDEFMTVLSREGMDGLLQRLRTTSQG